MIPRLLGRASAHLRRPVTLAVVGGASLALALGVVFLPVLFPPGVFRPVSAVLASPVAIALFGLVAGLLGAQALRQSATDAVGDDDAGPSRWRPDRAPERAHYDEYRTAGDAVDSAFHADPDGPEYDSTRREARNRIRETAVSVVAADESVDPETAARAIADGSWTDDPRAAAFLGGRHLAPLRTRIRDWASGERFERWAAQAVAEIEIRERGGLSGRNRDGESRDSGTADTGELRDPDAPLEVAEG